MCVDVGCLKDIFVCVVLEALRNALYNFFYLLTYLQMFVLLKGTTTSSKLGIQFLGLGYYYPSTGLPSLVQSVT